MFLRLAVPQMANMGKEPTWEKSPYTNLLQGSLLKRRDVYRAKKSVTGLTPLFLCFTTPQAWERMQVGFGAEEGKWQGLGMKQCAWRKHGHAPGESTRS